MKICLISPIILYSYQKEFLSVLTKIAKKQGHQIFAFTCIVDNFVGGNITKSDFSIYTLPNFSDYDGIIFFENVLYKGLNDFDIKKKIIDSGVPAICMDAVIPGMASVSIDNENSIYELVMHIQKEHGRKNINHITGRKGQSDSESRLDGYVKALRDSDIEVDFDRIYIGDFTDTGGEKAIDHFVKSKKPFDAVVCANDYMAIGAIRRLKHYGIKVPEDVIVTGFDGSEEGIMYYPSITSVSWDCCFMAEKAFDYFKNYDKYGKSHIVKNNIKLLLSESCGCNKDKRFSEEKIKVNTVDYILKSFIYKHFDVSIMKNLLYAESIEDIKKAAEIILQEVKMGRLYLCLDKENSFEVLHAEDVDPKSYHKKKVYKTSFSSDATMTLAFESGKFVQYADFKTSELLPAHCKEWLSPGTYLVLPIHDNMHVFGYAILSDERMLDRPDQICRWLQSLGIALFNIQQINQLKAMNRYMENMWTLDTFTGLYNRAGFNRAVPEIVKKCKRTDKQLYVVFADVDGLKFVNDSYGHDEGDRYILGIADAIKKSCMDGQIVMRYGGDEFVIVGIAENEGEVVEFTETLYAYIDTTFPDKKKYRASASLGYTMAGADEDIQWDNLISQADFKMYLEKKKKKSVRK
ncbi:MAG: GGDEF domain-containing protein [Parasporobacterium sp.]|nr:GGDEF domain-containing protein [Parasporobacterium sp.]